MVKIKRPPVHRRELEQILYENGVEARDCSAALDDILDALLVPNDAMWEASPLGKNPSWLAWQAMLLTIKEQPPRV